MEKLILIGAGGHSKSVVDSIDKSKYELCGFLDENKNGVHLGLPIFGSEIECIHNYREYSYFVSIGDTHFRKKWFEAIVSKRLEVINIIDPTAIISSSAYIGKGNFIGKYAVINADVIIGDNNVINTKALIEHECRVGSHCHLSTNSVINGNVVVEDSVFIGSSSVTIGQLKIGHDAIIGAGAVIINNIPPFVTAVGVPAKIIKDGMQNEQN